MATGTRGYLNNFSTTLAENISDSDTTFDITDDTGLDTILVTADYVALTIDDGTNVEIVHVTANSSGTITVDRAMEDTTAVGFLTGDPIELRATAASFEPSGGGGGLWEVIDTVTLAGSETFVKFEGLAAGIYEIDLHNISVDNGGSPPMLLMKIGTGGTPTYEASAYRYSLMNVADNSGTVSGVNPGSTSYITLWDAMYDDNANFVTCGTIKTADLGSARYKLFEIDIRQTQTGFGALAQYRRGVAAWNDTTAITALQIYPDAGAFRAGGVLTLLKRAY